MRQPTVVGGRAKWEHRLSATLCWAMETQRKTQWFCPRTSLAVSFWVLEEEILFPPQDLCLCCFCFLTPTSSTDPPLPCLSACNLCVFIKLPPQRKLLQAPLPDPLGSPGDAHKYFSSVQVDTARQTFFNVRFCFTLLPSVSL
jgi:hypothetical protein